jgi:hypothetical protein
MCKGAPATAQISSPLRRNSLQTLCRAFLVKSIPKNIPFLPKMYQKKLLADGQLSVKDIKVEGLRLFQIIHTKDKDKPHQRQKPTPKTLTLKTTQKNYLITVNMAILREVKVSF